jgi:uncharacterized membrane protein HdeD (DUF308 family)
MRKVLNLECAYMKSKLSMMWVMINGFAKNMPARVKRYVRENWGAPFIVGFMLLLLVAAVSLSMGLAVLADGVAIAAYYALVAGGVLQLVCFLKYNKKNGEKSHESS